MEQLPRERPWVIIDGDCAFCSSSTAWLVQRLHRRDRPDPRLVPYQFLDLAEFNLTESRTRQEMIWLPAESGPAEPAGGAAAFAAWLRYAGGAYAVLGRLLDAKPIRPPARLIYRIVAANRHRLPGGTPACALPPDRS